MKKTIIFDAEPFCFGPISTTLNLIEFLKKETDLDKDYSFVLLGTGTSLQLAKASALMDHIIECNTTSYESLSEQASVIEDSELFVSTTNPHSINFLNKFQTKRIYIDTLFWLWGELRADFSQVNIYYIQRFFNIKKQLEKFSEHIPSYKVVSPLIAYNLKAEEEEGFTLVNLGGIDTIYHKTSRFYEALVSHIYASNELKDQHVIIAGGGQTIEALKAKYERENLTISCFGKEQFKELFVRCKKFITTPGLTSIHESYFLGKDVFYLPAQNYSQYLHMTYLKKENKEAPGWHYGDHNPTSYIPEFLPEDEGISLVKRLSEELVKSKKAMEHLLQALLGFLQAPKKAFHLNSELVFSHSGVREIAQDIVALLEGSPLCHEGTSGIEFLKSSNM